jgi:Uma2 family endonuclease
MSTDLTQREYTPEDLLAMPDGDRYELVNGRLVERHMGLLADRIATRLASVLTLFCDDRLLGHVLVPSSGGFQGFPGSARTVRKPDVVFVSFSHLAGGELPTGYGQIIPDLAVEVISPNDLYEEVDEKIEEYLRAGVRLVWVISPQNHTVRIYRVNGTSHSARENDDLDGEDVVPGFRCRVGDLFPRPPAVPSGDGNGPPAPPA